MTSEIRVVLINATKFDYLRPPLGVLSLASYLSHKKTVKRENIKVIDITWGEDPIFIIKSFKPDVVGLSFVSEAYKDALLLAERIKKSLPEVIMIGGGTHISMLPEQLKESFDIGIMGEGEETLDELIKHLKKHNGINIRYLRKIKGLVYRSSSKDKFVITGKRSFIKPLDKIPNIDWSFLPSSCFRKRLIYIEDKPKALFSTDLYVNRGCPFNCIFCTRPVFWGNLRTQEPRLFADAVEDLYRNYHIENIWLWDDTFIVSKSYIKTLINLLKKRRLLGKVTFSGVGTRADMITDEWVALLKELGVIDVFIGFESGSSKILRKLKAGKIEASDNIKAVNIFEKYKINIWGSFIMGSPGEKDADLRATLKFFKWFAGKNNAIYAKVIVCTPVPNSPLWYQALKKGVVSPDMDFRKLSANLDRGVPRLFFNEGISEEKFRRYWREAQRIRRELRKRLEKKDGWQEAYKERNRYNKWASARLRWYFFQNAPLEIKLKKIGSSLGQGGMEKYLAQLLNYYSPQPTKLRKSQDYLSF